MKIWTRLSPPIAPSEAAPRGGQAPALRAPGGPIGLPGFHRPEPETAAQRLSGPFRRHPFLWAVILPTLLAAIYLFGVAAPQYISESRIMLRNQNRSATSMLGEVLNQSGFRAASEDTVGLRDYLLSHDAVAALRREMDLVAVFRRPEADVYARLWWPEPTAERLLDYYRHQVKALVDQASDIVTLTVRSFRPEDSLELSRRLLALGEARINALNQRLREESIRTAQFEIDRAERRVQEATAAITAFRQREQAVDPSRSALINVETIGRLDAEIARLRGELAQARAFSRPDAPQVRILQDRIAAADAQLLEERRRVAAAGTGVTEQIAAFERLRLEGEFAARQLVTATASMERAIADAERQQLFLVRVVEPNLAERSLYPKPVLFTVYVFAGLCLVYGLVWMVVAGVREHVA